MEAVDSYFSQTIILHKKKHNAPALARYMLHIARYIPN
jgi:hypothetical protein